MDGPGWAAAMTAERGDGRELLDHHGDRDSKASSAWWKGGRGGPHVTVGAGYGGGFRLSSRSHARMAVREGLLAIATLCEDVLRAAERRTEGAKRRVERIAVSGARRRGPRKHA